MNRFARSFFFTLATFIGGLFCVCLPAFAAPQINNQINYQARLMDASGFPVADGNYSIIFSLYDAATAGTRLWTAKGSVAVPTALTVNVQNGLFTVLLGDTSAGGGTQNTLDSVDWNSDQIFLGVTIAADSEMSPRKRFASAPQAFNSRQLQGMYASSTASGGQTLFAINQTEATAATGTRTALDVKTSGTSNANDFLIRGLDGTNTTVFSVNRQGNATTSFLNASNVFVSGLTTSTNLFANIATFATATVAGRGICLSDGSFCSSGSFTEADTLASVTNRGAFSTTTLSLFGGFVAASSSVTGTLTVAGNFVVTGNSTLGSTTATNLASTGLFTFGTATGVQITANTAIFNTATITNLFATTGTINTLNFLNATGTTLNALTLSANTVTSTAVFVNGQPVCLADGTNCSASFLDTLQSVTARGSFTTTTVQLFGGFVAASSSVTGTLNVIGSLHVTGTANIALQASSTPFAITVPAALAGGQSLGFTLSPSSSSNGISMGKLNSTDDYTLFSFSNNVATPLAVSGTAMYYDHTKSEYVTQLLGSGGITNFKATFRMSDLDSAQATAKTAFEIRNESTNSSTRVLLLENGPSSFITQHVGGGSPEGVIYDNAGSIYFNPMGATSGTQAYLKTGFTFSNTGWKGIATVDMLSSGGGSTSDANWTFNLLGDFVRNATPTTDVIMGSSTYAGAPFIFQNNSTTSRLIIGQNPLTGAGADVVIGATTSSNMHPSFQLTGDDLFVAGNIGSASSIYTNGSFVAGSSTTYYSENEIATNVPFFNIHATSGAEIDLTVSSTLLASFAYDSISIATQHKGSGAGGNLNLTGGFGQLGTDQGGGFVLISGGDADTSGVVGDNGGGVNLTGGTGWGLGMAGGAITIVGGSAGNDGSGGYLSFAGGSVFGADGNGGDIYLNASAGAGSGQGGSMYVSSGDSFGASSAGSVTYNLGSAYGSGDGGNFQLNAGLNFGSGQAGNIILNPGISTGTGDAGHVTLPSTFGFAPPDLRFVEAASIGSDFVGFRAPNSVTSSTIWKLPGSDGTAGQVISTDGLGNLSFTSGGGGGSSDPNWTYNSASDFVRNATASTDIVLGSTATSTGAPVYFDLSGVSTGSSTVYFGYATKTNVIVGGTSTTASGLNPLFTMDGNDLLVTGMIGTDELYAAGRVDAPHLNRWFTNPLLTQTIYQGGSSTLAVANSPDGVLFDGSYIWVSTTDGLNPGYVLKIDPITNTVVATTTVGISPGAMAFDGTYLWVAQVNSVSPSITKINVNTNSVVDTISMASDFPFSIVFDGTYIWATSFGSFPAPGELAKIDPITDTIVATSNPGSGTSGLAFDGYYLWTANLNDGTVVKIDRDSMQVVATTTLGGIPESVVFDGSYIWATNRVPSSVSKIDISTAAVVVTIPITSRPRYEVFDGKYIWVSNDFTGELYRIDPNTNSLAQTSNVGGAPRGVASDGSHIWAANSQGYVTKTPFQYGPSTNGYTMTLGYTSATNYGGLCVDDYGTGATCPANPGASIVADGAIISNAFDLAETYSVTGTYAAGDVLVLDGSSTTTVKRSTGIANDSAIVGVVSTDPGFVLGWNGGARVALAGQVPVKISMNAGAIHVGDAIASADVAGYAMKATSPGMILGYALEDASATGTATLMINVGFWSGLAFGPSGSIQLDDSGNVSIMHDLHVGGKLFPSSKGGGIQNDWYLFVDDTDASSTYISTNASGFQSLDTYDFAERYYSPDELEPGDLVVVSDSGRTHVQRSWNVDAMLLGIVSTRPAFIAGRPATSTYPIALSGRVPTKVSNMNGTIKAGDPLSPTTIPGVAAKAIHSGPIIGLALEDYTNVGIEKIEVFVNPGYWVNKDETVAPAPAPSSTEPVSSPTVVSTNKQGFATITTGATKVHIEFPSLGAYPNVQVTPRGSTHGGWWTDNYTDTGFDILLSEAEFHDVIFTWRVEASTADDVMRMSDGTFGSIDPLTGIPILMAPTSTEPIPPPPMTETTSTEPIEIPPDSSVTST